eukprot:CAMPEP_0203752234 /NCGR_PEP_ID=MMETSP0098-20131031/6182_1 /ASSEMBLY_ACC=CAM_ASM_000208 /TAXON_ID=96639 /ORGANISM=" , Strain NY0313808BC1" /LENGTH=123 /DNA_ID=CAMNT_0050642303 /DNA_START=241 /DNA_END=610 /DNA_ORIENTATION=+
MIHGQKNKLITRFRQILSANLSGTCCTTTGAAPPPATTTVVFVVTWNDAWEGRIPVVVEDNPEGVGHTRNPGVAAVRILGAEAVRILEGVVARILEGVVARIPVEEGLVPDLVDKVGVSPTYL